MRRVVCGRLADGKWGVLRDEGPGSVFEHEGFVFSDLWSVDSPSLDTTDLAASTSVTDIYDLPVGASRFRIGVFPPMTAPEIWHRTDSIDYEYIISGEIDLLMEDGSAVTLKAGDSNIQLGGNHQWFNRSSADCVMAIVMIGVPADGDPGSPADAGTG